MSQTRQYPLNSIVFWALTLGAVVVFVALRLRAIVPFGWLFDEGAHLTSALALREGYRLYSEIEVLEYPVLPELLDAVFRVFSPSLQLARTVCIGMAALYLPVISLTGRRLSTWVGGSVALAVLASDELLFRDSGHVLSETPALTAAGATVLFAMMYVTSGKRAYVCAAGVFCAVSLLTKALVPFLPIWLAAVVVVRNWRTDPHQSRLRWTSFVIEGALTFVSFCAPLAASMLAYDPVAFVKAVYQARASLRAEEGWSLGWNLSLIWEPAHHYVGAVLLAAVGTWASCKRNHARFRSMLLLWLLLTLMLLPLLVYAPLFTRHCVILSLPIALLAGISISDLVDLQNLRLNPSLWLTGVSAALLTLVFIGINVADVNAWAKDRARYGEGGPEAAAVDLLERVTSPSELIAADDLILAFQANRRVPPQLSDISHARNLSGHLTASHVTTVVNGNDIQAVCLWTNRFTELTAFADWARTHYVTATDFGQGREVLYGRRYDSLTGISGLIPTVGSVLGNSAALVGYRLAPREAQIGNETRLVLYWQCLSPLKHDYQVFVHLANRQGQPIAQADGAPAGGLYPTSRWVPGEILADVHRLPIAESVAPGDYTLQVGMYDLASMKRLSITSDLSGATHDSLVLTSVHLDSIEVK